MGASSQYSLTFARPKWSLGKTAFCQNRSTLASQNDIW